MITFGEQKRSLGQKLTMDGESEHAPALIWIDIETSGLDPAEHGILELAARVTHEDLEPAYRDLHLLGDLSKSPPIHSWSTVVIELHSRSNLLVDCSRNGASMIQRFRDWVDEVARSERAHGRPGSGFVMAGSSVHFDRKFIEQLITRLDPAFSHRNLDVSGLRELCKRYKPEAVWTVPEEDKEHRALADLESSIAQLKHYRKALGI